MNVIFLLCNSLNLGRNYIRQLNLHVKIHYLSRGGRGVYPKTKASGRGSHRGVIDLWLLIIIL